MLGVWLVLAAVLVIIELQSVAFWAIFVAAGCVAAALVAAVAPGALVAQAGIGLVVSLVGAVAVRPIVSRAIEQRRQGHLVRGVHGGLVGEQTVTLDQVGEPPYLGHVQVAGERWLAKSGSGTTLPEGTRVVVTGVSGTTLEVWPVDDLPMLDE